MAAASSAQAANFTIIYNYSTGADNSPAGGVTVGPDGTLYGSTWGGGPAYDGAVFKLVKPKSGSGLWARPLLHSFLGGSDGATPNPAPVLAKSGLLYGTAWGGTSSYGVVYEVNPAVGPASYKVIYNFTGKLDGGYPIAGVAFDKHGALYGTTTGQGKGANGTIFKLTPPGAGKSSWTETTLYSFNKNATDGAYATGEMTLNAAGVVYGTTSWGGVYNAGVIYALTPPAAGKTAWTFAHLHVFTGGADGGAGPGMGLISGLVADKAGAFYGTTVGGGTNGGGVVFRLIPPTATAKAAYKVLHNFANVASFTEGSAPNSGVAIDAKGGIYGTTTGGGANLDGIMYKLTPPAPGKSAWIRAILYNFGSFKAPEAGDSAAGRLAIGPDGAVYGSTQEGGVSYGGTVFRYTP